MAFFCLLMRNFQIPFIEGAKDVTAEEIAGAIAQESRIPITTQTAQPGVTTGASAGNSDILESTGTEVLQYKPATEDIRVKLEKQGFRKKRDRK